MLMKATAFKHLLKQQQVQRSQTLTLLFARNFSQSAQLSNKAAHEKRHMGVLMDPKFYENDYMAGKTNELEFVRSPFYDLAKKEQLKKEQVPELIDEITHKLNHIEGLEIFLQPPIPSRENVAYTRYADIVEDPESRSVF